MNAASCRVISYHSLRGPFVVKYMPSSVHSIAKVGFGAGTNELYDRARPSYQAPALSHIRSTINVAPPLNVVELGSGTGICTRALLAHPDWSSSISTLKAFEPSEGMRQVFSDKVKDSRVSIAEGYFDHVPVEDQWADVIIVAQALHWCPDYEKAAQEFCRILKPNGILAFIWNLEDRDAAHWVAQLRDRIEKHEHETPQFRLGLWRQIYDAPSFQKFFNPAEENTWCYNLPSTADIATARALSKSYIAVLSDSERKSVADDIKTYIEEGEGKVWIDELQGTFKYPYQTLVVITTKK